MNKYYGLTKDFTPVRTEGTRVVVSYGKVVIDETHSEWRDVTLFKKQVPNVGLKEVKTAIINDINSRTSDAIRNGFPYTIKHGGDEGKQVNVWLSKENQENLLLAAGTSAPVFPLKYKVAEDAEGKPIYEEFADSAEVAALCSLGAEFIFNTLQVGWSEKDGIDWSIYEALFPVSENENQDNE